MTTRDASTVEGLANAAYQAGDYAAAADLGDELVRLDPDNVIGWQIRANSRIFALRHEEALVLPGGRFAVPAVGHVEHSPPDDDRRHTAVLAQHEAVEGDHRGPRMGTVTVNG